MPTKFHQISHKISSSQLPPKSQNPLKNKGFPHYIQYIKSISTELYFLSIFIYLLFMSSIYQSPFNSYQNSILCHQNFCFLLSSRTISRTFSSHNITPKKKKPYHYGTAFLNQTTNY